MTARPSLFALAAALLLLGFAACGSGITQNLPIGSPCTANADCGTSPFFCAMTLHPDGYCKRTCKVDGDCPTGSNCVHDGDAGECHKDCSSDSDCRTGYTCEPASSDASHAFCDPTSPT